LIGQQIRRGSETFDTNSISDRVLLGLPESTAITIINSYYDLKQMYPYFDNKQIYEMIMVERGHDRNTITQTLKYDYSLQTFIVTMLKLYDQSDFLDPYQIMVYIDEYKKITNQT
jgi:hypothetical protein